MCGAHCHGLVQAHKQELLQQIAEKQAAADALQAEHARLAGRHPMLQSILGTQHTAVGILQGQDQARYAYVHVKIAF